MIVLHYHPLDGPLADRLRAALDPGIDLRVPGPGVNLDALAPLCDGVIAGRLSFDWLRAARNLRFQVVPYAGVPAQDRTQVAMLPAVTLYNSHFNADVTAEHAWALLLAAAKRLLPAHARLARGDWTPRYDGPLSARLAGARLLVLGHGAVGGRVAAIGRAFGMRVDAVTRHGQPAPGLERTGTTAALRALLAEADAIVCCLPDTPATAGLLNAAAFAAMKPGAVFVNVGRGACVDEGALHDALTGGRLGAAGLDTWWRYPTVPEERAACPPGRRDWAGVENVVLSPHRASHAEGREEARMDELAALLNAIARGAPPRPVDLAEGY